MDRCSVRDSNVTDVLFERGWTEEPRGKTKSVVLTEEGSQRVEAFFIKHFESCRLVCPTREWRRPFFRDGSPA